jgi:glycosyltransferase involved in cell wall biosynthesis
LPHPSTQADLDAPPAAVADAVEAVLSDPGRLRAVGARAAATARAWDLQAYARQLVGLVQRALGEGPTALSAAAAAAAAAAAP